jgi:3-methyladenine DNA glycosylase Tag
MTKEEYYNLCVKENIIKVKRKITATIKKADTNLSGITFEEAIKLIKKKHGAKRYNEIKKLLARKK